MFPCLILLDNRNIEHIKGLSGKDAHARHKHTGLDSINMFP
uniref:Uncharacterized protein n=1 Tax=Anguilla anguilla TaxID=7936 RepID=A0A0E9VWC0_ANGAN